jgi:hypothetical protein
MILAARHAGGRMAYRDSLLITKAYRHGFRASELGACPRNSQLVM